MAWWLIGLVVSAWGAEEPCYGHSYANRVDSDHFWVEWQDGVITRRQAEDIARVAEEARETYLGLGWPMPSRAVVIAVNDDAEGGMGGIAETSPCDGEPVPRVTLFVAQYSPGRMEGLVAHEIGHVAQYGYMGAYLDGVASWLWFMEGTAGWLQARATDDPTAWARTAQGYYDNPHHALHAGPPAFLSTTRSRHMYGTVALVSFLEEEGGGPDAVRALWEWGGERSGEAIFFPDALNGAGFDFDVTWPRWMAASTVADQTWGIELNRSASHLVVEELPAAGSVGAILEGMGLDVLRFVDPFGASGAQALSVTVSVLGSAPWKAALVATDGATPGSRVVEYVPLDLQRGDDVTTWLDPQGGASEAFLVVSPITRENGVFEYTWTAERIPNPGRNPEAVPFREAGEGCACNTNGGAPGAWALLPLLWLVRRRR